MQKMVPVAVGVIMDDAAGTVLLGKRKAWREYGGRWEFPGGKVELGESYFRALVRELREELGVEVRIRRFLGKHIFVTERGNLVDLRYFLCELLPGQVPKQVDHDEIAWVEISKVHEYPTMPVDGILAALLVKPVYCSGDSVRGTLKCDQP
jgi:mutator protein MutT